MIDVFFQGFKQIIVAASLSKTALQFLFVAVSAVSVCCNFN